MSEQFSSKKAVKTAAAGGAVLSLGGALFGQALPAGAADAEVTSTADDGAGSLRVAIEQANTDPGLDEITFAPGLGTITLDTEIAITDDLTITGPATISGDDSTRIFYIDTGGDVTLTGLTLQDGSASEGGAISVYDVDVFTLQSSTITGSDATDGSGGGLLFSSESEVQIHDSTFSANTATDSGGGAYLHTDTDSDQPLVVSGSTFDDNHAGSSGGGLMTHHAYDVTIDTTTFSNNDAGTGGGGAYLGAEGGTLTFTSSTVSGNDALDGSGGGLFVYGFDYVDIAHSTIAGDNTATVYGGGVAIYSADEVTIDHTIIGGNSAPDYADLAVYDSNVVTVINSLVQADIGPDPFDDAGGNVLGEDPGVAALADNGGPNQTHALTATSPALDGGDPDFAPPPATDQRGLPRVQGAAVDIGAYEAQPEEPAPRPDEPTEPPAAEPAAETPTFTG